MAYGTVSVCFHTKFEWELTINQGYLIYIELKSVIYTRPRPKGYLQWRDGSGEVSVLDLNMVDSDWNAEKRGSESFIECCRKCK